jgi:ribonuclease-3
LSRPAPRLRATVEDAIGHEFGEPRLLDEALAHARRLTGRRAKSAVPSHERLEFLGDRVLGLVVAGALLERYPREAEGILNLRLVQLVRAEALAEVGMALGADRWLRQGAGDAEAPVTAAVLADTVEALIGALYLDGGLEAAERFVRRHWADLIESGPTPRRDAKTALQEWAQGRGLALPSYRLVEAQGPDHAPSFEVEVAIGDMAPVGGRGASKRAAEQMAADSLLRQLGVRRDG